MSAATAFARDVLNILRASDQALTVFQVTRRYQKATRSHSAIGMRVRETLDQLVTEGLAEYLDGAGNNRHYRALDS